MNVKKSIGMLSLLASVFAFVACSNNEEVALPEATKTVSFTAELPNSMLSRAASSVYGDGTKATTLYYAVYSEEAEGDQLVVTNYGAAGDAAYVDDAVSFSGLKATVNFSLAIGHTYKFAFWAQSPEATCYSLNTAAATMTVDYSNMLFNDENLDAFYSNATLLFGEATENQTITLTRPFAQVNVGATDAEAAAAIGVSLAKTELTIVGASNTLNLLTGETSGFVMSAVYNYNVVPALQEGSGVFPAKEDGKYVDAVYAGMAYVLVNGKQNLDLQFNYEDAAGNILNVNDVHYFHNVPIERNHRTNIYGGLLLGKQSWNVEIDNSFIEPDYNTEYDQSKF